MLHYCNCYLCICAGASSIPLCCVSAGGWQDYLEGGWHTHHLGGALATFNGEQLKHTYVINGKLTEPVVWQVKLELT